MSQTGEDEEVIHVTEPAEAPVYVPEGPGIPEPTRRPAVEPEREPVPA